MFYKSFLMKTMFGAAAIIMISGQARANGTCVICDEPSAMYVCETTASPEHQIFLQNQRLVQLACVKQIAETYRHGSCKANQKDDGMCVGELVSIDVSIMAQQYTNRLPRPLRPDLSQVSPTPLPPPEPTAPQEEEPKTVVELANKTVENSKNQLKKAGQAVKDAGKVVGDSAEKTWQCLSSLFQNC